MTRPPASNLAVRFFIISHKTAYFPLTFIDVVAPTIFQEGAYCTRTFWTTWDPKNTMHPLFMHKGAFNNYVDILLDFFDHPPKYPV